MADDDYEVGFGKTPKHTRFKPGQSGNPRGRPKGTKGLNALLSDALAEKVTITEGGRRRRISKAEAIFKQLVNKGASGDPTAVRLLVGMIHLSEGREGPATAPDAFAEDDLKVIADLKKRLKQS